MYHMSSHHWRCRWYSLVVTPPSNIAIMTWCGRIRVNLFVLYLRVSLLHITFAAKRCKLLLLFTWFSFSPTFHQLPVIFPCCRHTVDSAYTKEFVVTSYSHVVRDLSLTNIWNTRPIIIRAHTNEGLQILRLLLWYFIYFVYPWTSCDQAYSL